MKFGYVLHDPSDMYFAFSMVTLCRRASWIMRPNKYAAGMRAKCMPGTCSVDKNLEIEK